MATLRIYLIEQNIRILLRSYQATAMRDEMTCPFAPQREACDLNGLNGCCFRFDFQDCDVGTINPE